MSKTISDVFPPASELLDMEPEEIAPFLLQYLVLLDEEGSSGQLNRYNFTLETNDGLRNFAGEKLHKVTEVMTEAWAWLEREGFIAPKPGTQGEWVFITRKGKRLKTLTDFQAYSYGDLLPSKKLDPILSRKVKPLFIRGDYDTAVFQSYKEVEVRIRQAAGLPDDLVGVQLARKAFAVKDGQLSDKTVVEAEREAMTHLMAGALGAFKNPTSHRDINLNDPNEVAELIMFANYLLRVIDARGRNKTP